MPLLIKYPAGKCGVLLAWCGPLGVLPVIGKLVKNPKKLSFLEFPARTAHFFLFLTNFFGLYIKFSYGRSKNDRSPMPLLIKYPAKCGVLLAWCGPLGVLPVIGCQSMRARKRKRTHSQLHVTCMQTRAS